MWPPKLPEKCCFVVFIVWVHFVFVCVSSIWSNWFILIWESRTYPCIEFIDSSFCCWSWEDALEQLESFCAIFLKVQIPCKQTPWRPLWSSCKPCDVTTQKTRTQVPKICLLHLGQIGIFKTLRFLFNTFLAIFSDIFWFSAPKCLYFCEKKFVS